MRWITPVPPIGGDERTRKAFLWLPLKIGRETRWMETASWTERYRAWTQHWLPDQWLE